ncbi:MAG: hypothetical protein KUG77_23930, partial [Nannocystaceae bacterium]|nr:hypothetical protein [Nannocystaceae bacterium]
MNSWVTEPEKWAAWTQEQAVARPSDTLDSFDAEVARRLGTSGFGANLEETVVTNIQTMGPPPSDPGDGDATLIRPTPEQRRVAEDFSDAAETMVHGRVEQGLEVSLEAPESGLEVGLDTAASSDRRVVAASPPPAGPEDPLDGLVLPSLTTMPEAMPESDPAIEPIESGTVVAPRPLAPSVQTVIAPAPTAPESTPVQPVQP